MPIGALNAPWAPDGAASAAAIDKTIRQAERIALRSAVLNLSAMASLSIQPAVEKTLHPTQ